jgi:hypothetical protein
MEHVRDYELKAFFSYVIGVLERLEIPYMVVGGFAAIFYGEPRLTIDVDIVVDMRWEHINPLVAAFPIPDYYISEEGIRDSLQRCYPFNVIQPTTGAKVGQSAHQSPPDVRSARTPGCPKLPDIPAGRRTAGT